MSGWDEVRITCSEVYISKKVNSYYGNVQRQLKSQSLCPTLYECQTSAADQTILKIQ